MNIAERMFGNTNKSGNPTYPEVENWIRLYLSSRDQELLCHIQPWLVYPEIWEGIVKDMLEKGHPEYIVAFPEDNQVNIILECVKMIWEDTHNNRKVCSLLENVNHVVWNKVLARCNNVEICAISDGFECFRRLCDKRSVKCYYHYLQRKVKKYMV